MRSFLILVLFLLSPLLYSKNKVTGDVPLINREILLGNPEITSPAISPDGKKIAFLKPYNGNMNIWFKNINENYNMAKPINNKEIIYSFYWTSDSSIYCLYQIITATKTTPLILSIFPITRITIQRML